MTPRQFLSSKWMRLARQPGAERKVRHQFTRWIGIAANLRLAANARRLYRYLTSGRVTGPDKFIVIAALLYLISPVDLVPDWLPVAGWLDDLGIATAAINLILKRLDRAEIMDQPIEGTPPSRP